MRDQRRHQRIYMNCKVQISHPDFGTQTVEAKDFSDSGIFLSMDTDHLPEIGTIFTGQIQGMGEEGQLLNMEVVRSGYGGVGLRFCKDKGKKLH